MAKTMLFHNMLVKIHLQIIWLAKQDTSIKIKYKKRFLKSGGWIPEQIFFF